MATTNTGAGKERLVRNISDTALWVACFRARETERPDALFRDPYARKLAGERGEQIATATAKAHPDWPYAARTVRFDQIIREQIQQGADLVVNLAAGLDTRPYRMDLPVSLQWVEVDLPEILNYKEEILGEAQPRCRFERVRLDLSDIPARQKFFQELGPRGTNALVITEGLLGYLSSEENLALARDLADQPSFRNWALDMVSPGLLKMLQKTLTQLNDAGSPLKFGPEEGPAFFVPAGWKPVEVYSMLKTAARLNRVPLMLKLFSFLPESNGRQGSRPWGAVCRLTRVN
jgi:methyltransferase (TIGR00027 family)